MCEQKDFKFRDRKYTVLFRKEVFDGEEKISKAFKTASV